MGLDLSGVPVDLVIYILNIVILYVILRALVYRPVQRFMQARANRVAGEMDAAVAERVSIPILVYNVPSRTGLNVLPATMAELLKLPNIVGIKEASGNIEQIVNLAALCPDCDIYAGNDDHVVPMLSVGAKGVISTIGNVVPQEMHDMCAAFFAGDLVLARQIQFRVMPIWKAAFCEVNPIPTKAMMEMLGLCSGELRLPLVPPAPESREKIAQTLQSAGLL